MLIHIIKCCYINACERGFIEYSVKPTLNKFYSVSRFEIILGNMIKFSHKALVKIFY